MQGEVAPSHGKETEGSVKDTGGTWKNPAPCPGPDDPTYLYVNSVELALLPVDVQAKLLAHLADLRSTVHEVNPPGLALLPFISISCQVVQQL